MRRLVVDAPAKLNLFLEVLGRRPDGYHDLATVMAPIDVADTLELRPADRFSLEVEGAALPGVNTVVKAWRALRRRRRVPAVRVRLVKRIPAGSGLGGGSSDAAAFLRAMDVLAGPGLPIGAVAAEVGSDVNFFLQDRPALCTGRGERVSPLGFPLPVWAVVAWPGVGLSTAEVYRRVREFLTPRPRPVMDFLNRASEPGPGLGKALFNRLEKAALELRPELGALLRCLARLPFAGVRMTGSGSAVYGVCRGRDEARALARRVRRETGGWAAAAGPPREDAWTSLKSGSSW